MFYSSTLKWFLTLKYNDCYVVYSNFTLIYCFTIFSVVLRYIFKHLPLLCRDMRNIDLAGNMSCQYRPSKSTFPISNDSLNYRWLKFQDWERIEVFLKKKFCLTLRTHASWQRLYDYILDAWILLNVRVSFHQHLTCHSCSIGASLNNQMTKLTARHCWKYKRYNIDTRRKVAARSRPPFSPFFKRTIRLRLMYVSLGKFYLRDRYKPKKK